MTPRSALLSAALLGFLGVALGAFGAHALKGWLATLDDGAQRLAWWQTAVEYQLWHAALAAAVGAWLGVSDVPRPARLVVPLVVAGTVLFSGSLYAMTLTGVRALGMVTPLGGLSFLGAWSCLGLAALRTRRA